MSIKKLVVLGASGSIGQQTLKLIEDYPTEFSLVGVSVNSNAAFLCSILKRFPSVKYCCVGENLEVDQSNDKIYLKGREGLNQIVKYSDVDIVVNAISGFAGLEPTLTAIEADKDIAIACKEAIVCGGELIKKALDKHPVKYYPVDSEHSAIYQCLVGEKKNQVHRLIITASGGPFRDYKKEELEKVTVEQALKHPNWQMGKKITIDCATLVNKGLEIIEAHYLFDMPYEQIVPIIHYESVVHSLVEFVDGSIKAQLGYPSMECPILYAISQGKRMIKNDQRLDLLAGLDLRFRPVDYDKFPAIKLAYKVGKLGGSAPTAFSIANEVAVQAFMNHQISYLDIVKIVNKIVDEHKIVKEFTFSELSVIVDEIKKKTQQLCAEGGVK